MKLFFCFFICLFWVIIIGLQAQTDLRFEYLSEQDGLSNNRILSIHQDREGFIWFGTWEGLNKFDGYTFTVFQPDSHNPTQTLSHNVISDIVEDRNGLLWLATRGGGLNHIDKRSGKVTTYLLDSTGDHYWNALVDIYADRKGDFWICSAGGLAMFDLRSRTFTRFPSPEEKTMIVSVAEDPMGRLWAASTSKLYHFDRTTGDIWIATRGGGINRLNPESGKFEYYKLQYPLVTGGLNDKDIRAMYEDSSGIIWVGTNQGGLNQFDPETEKFVSYTVNQGLPSNHIESMVEDHRGNLWIGTSKGLSRFDPHAMEFRNYSTMDGLPGNIFNQGSKSTVDGKLYFGTTNGFIVLHPDSIKDNINIPPVYITGLKVLEKEITLLFIRE